MANRPKQRARIEGLRGSRGRISDSERGTGLTPIQAISRTAVQAENAGIAAPRQLSGGETTPHAYAPHPPVGEDVSPAKLFEYGFTARPLSGKQDVVDQK